MIPNSARPLERSWRLIKLIDPAGCHNQKPMEMDMTSGDREQLKTWIEGDRDTLVAFLRAFVRCRGPNPPGETRSTAEFITGELARHRVDYRIIAPHPEMPNIVATFE